MTRRILALPGLHAGWVIAFLLLLLATAAQGSERKDIFVLHSYSQEYDWTKRQHEGFVAELARDATTRYSVRAEYLDTKRVSFDAGFSRMMAEHLAAKYRGYSPSAIYVTDDNALVFALEHLRRIFPAAPVIFSGVNDLGVATRIDRAVVTGVFERKEIAPNLELVRVIGHDARDFRDIVVVGDGSETYRAIEQEIRLELARHPGIQARFVADRNLDGVLQGLKSGQEHIVVLTTLGNLVDAQGAPMLPDDSIAAIAELGRHTILSMEDGYIVKGVLGGYVTSGVAQGEAAARLVARYFAGTQIVALETVESPNKYLVDAVELRRAGLTLPPAVAAQATILNPLPGVYERFQREILYALYALGTLLLLSLTASLAIVMRKNRQIGANAAALRQQAVQMADVQDSLVRAQRIAALGNWDWNIADDNIFWSDETWRIFGLDKGRIAVDLPAFLDRVHAEDRDAVQAAVLRARTTGEPYDITHRIVLPSGEVRVVRENAEVLHDSAGTAVRIHGTIMDVTARERAVRALHDSEEKLRKVIESLPVVLWMIDRDGRFLLSEGNGLAAMGLGPGEVVGRSLFDVYSDCPEVVEDTHRVLEGQTFACTRQIGELAFELRYSPMRNEAGEVRGAIGVAIDVTERKQSEDRLVFLANYDPVTGLANRFLFLNRLTHAMQSADRQNAMVALLFVDLDNFKNVNDSLGHAAGDQLLKEVAARLGAVVRSTDTVSRLGGDEFTLVLEGLASADEAVRVASQLLAQATRPYTLGSREVHVTCSVGIAIYPHDGDTVDTLLKNADAAMYQAKENGRNRLEFFTKEINAGAHERLELVNQLRGALARNEFSLHYQPKIDLVDSSVVGFEALLRWRNARLGQVFPATFIPVLEEIGLIVEVGEWVLREACRWAAAIPHRSGTAPPSIAVNLSARQFRHAQLDKVVQSSLAVSGLAAGRLEMEITESSLMDIETNLATMDRMKALGVALSIDDFGTGHSSLSYLKRFPVDRLKIDASFVRDVAVDADDAAIVIAIIGLAHHLQLGVVAEGVETQEQLDFLRRHGCDEVQGNLLGRPMPGPQALGWLSRRQLPALVAAS